MQNERKMMKNQQFPIHEATPLARRDKGVCCGEDTLLHDKGVHRSEGTLCHDEAVHCGEPKEQQTKDPFPR